MQTFEEARAAKFERGRREHGQPWDAQHIDAVSEMQDELCDFANYADLLDNKELAATFQCMARLLWRILNEMRAS